MNDPVPGMQPQISAFEQIKRIGSDGQEFWSARELYPLLEYAQWRDFYNVLQEAMTVYRQSGGTDVDTIFQQTTMQFTRRSGRKYTVTDYHLSRHACYLAVLSADGTKSVISLAKQTALPCV